MESIEAVLGSASGLWVVLVTLIEPLSEDPANVPAYVVYVVVPPPGGVVGLSSFLQPDKSNTPIENAMMDFNMFMILFLPYVNNLA